MFLTEIEELSQGARVVTEELGYRVKNPLHDHSSSSNNNNSSSSNNNLVSSNASKVGDTVEVTESIAPPSITIPNNGFSDN